VHQAIGPDPVARPMPGGAIGGDHALRPPEKVSGGGVLWNTGEVETESPPVAKGRSDLELRIVACGAEQVYPLELWRLNNGQMVGIVTEVYGNSDLVRIARLVADALDEQAPKAALLFRLFPGVRTTGSTSGAWQYAWSREGGQHRLVDFDELAALGLDLLA
jgi:hypothetical protein